MAKKKKTRKQRKAAAPGTKKAAKTGTKKAAKAGTRRGPARSARTAKEKVRGKDAGHVALVQDVPLHLSARRRYLNYAMSVITARALPDVRDGLKPVQRRILYTMQHELRLAPGSKPLKCARIVGDVLGKFHPHGDTAVYDALVRMAQDFSLRYPLIDGHGNFGSLDGDGAAAYRYTEATLEQLASELLRELPRDTVNFRPNYDGKTREPAVLPARIPNLLANGATGIAVGLATNIPPHNMGEVAAACEALIADRDLKVSELVKIVKGPDFPTGGHILNSTRDIRKIYEEGQGSVRVRAEYHLEESGRNPKIVITSIPYMVQKDVLVRAIGDLIFARKVPQLLDVRDESTRDVRIVLELKKEADAEVVMAYLFKNTSLQTNFNVNLTCLVPADDGNEGTCAPARLDLKTILLHFIEFRYAVVERRFQFDLRRLEERIHILTGFRKVFSALDEAIKIVRNAKDRPDASQKLRRRFKLDDKQAEAILDLRLYKLARLEIKSILDELKDKKKEAAEIKSILSSSRRLWSVVRKEIAEVRKQYGDERRTQVGGRGIQETEYSEEEFIVDEDAYIVLSRDGWVKRVGRISDVSKLRLRTGDEILAVLAGNTRSLVVFFSNFGSAYTTRINEIPPSRGYGDPIQKLFKFRDGEKVVGALSLDARMRSDYGTPDDAEGTIPKNHLLAVGSSGYALRCSLVPFAEVSTRAGRRFMRLKGSEEVVGVREVQEGNVAMVASEEGRVLLFPVNEVNFLSGPGRGVMGIKIDKTDRVVGMMVSRSPKDAMVLHTTDDRRIEVNSKRYRVTGRGGKGVEVIRRGGIRRVELPPVEVPVLPESDVEESSDKKNGR